MHKKELTRRQRLLILGGLIFVGAMVGLGIGITRFLMPTISETSNTPPPPLPTLESAAEIPPTPQSETPLRADGSPYPSLYIPQAGISEYIIESLLRPEGWQVQHLGDRIGHLEGTGWVNSGGNIVLAGHVEDSEGNSSIFANINDLEMGTIITINDNGTAHHYSVTEILTVDAADLSVVYPTNRERVTLITCTGYDFFSDSYQQRVVVVGERVEGELPDPAF